MADNCCTGTINSRNFVTTALKFYQDTEKGGTAVAQWLRCCATNRKVADSIPDGTIGNFH